MKRIQREAKLTPSEAEEFRSVRQRVSEELPELVARHHERAAADESLVALIESLRSAREEQGLSLAAVTERTGMDRSALSKLETGLRPNPTFETLTRYATAVGKRIVVTLVDRQS